MVINKNFVTLYKNFYETSLRNGHIYNHNTLFIELLDIILSVMYTYWIIQIIKADNKGMK